MKKTILKMLVVTGMVTGAVMSSNAQISKGSLMFGGSLGANIAMESKTAVGSVSVTTPGYTEWNFSPTAGYFIADGLVVGLGLNLDSKYMYQVSTTDKSKTENIMASGLGVNLIVRKYFEIESKVYFHAQAGLGYSSMNYTDRDKDGASALKDGDKFSGTTIGINITPGLTYFVSPKWGIDFSLNNILAYNSSTLTQDDGVAKVETTSGGISVGAGLTPTLGLFYYMGK